MKQFYITTLGCKVNQYESDGIAFELISKGWVRLTDPKGANYCIINSCAVTSKAAMQSRQTIRSIIKANPDAVIIATGCHVQTEPDRVSSIDTVHYIVGHPDKTRIASAILRLDQKSHKDPAFKKKTSLFSTIPEACDSVFRPFKPGAAGNRTRAYLKIQDGCSAKCTYCIVPKARGRSSSMPVNDVIEQLKQLDQRGFKEVIITGIHTGAYGLDLPEKSSITKLLNTIVDQRPVHRVRLSSIEPGELTDEIISRATESRVLCDHFHIPLQSGDDTVLKRMKRPYNRKQFKELILKINSTLPFVALGIDILVGFPGESEAEFQNTVSLIRELPISYLHVFPFSPRPGTPAFGFPGRIDPDTLKKRAAIMRRLGQKKKRAFQERNLGRTLEAVIQETPDKQSGLFKAITSNYLTVMVDKADNYKKEVVQIFIESLDKNDVLHGRL